MLYVELKLYLTNIRKKEEVIFDEELKLHIIAPPQYIMYICIGE